MVGPFVGSEGTETNCLRFVKGTKVTIKNGTIRTLAPTAAVLIQNFSDSLILDGVTLKGKASTQYLLSNNYGNVILRNGTTIKATGGHVAVDAHYSLNSEYDKGVTVEIEDPSVVISGAIEYTKDSRIKDDSQFLSKAHFIVPADYEGITAPEGYTFEIIESTPDKKELRPTQTTEDVVVGEESPAE